MSGFGRPPGALTFSPTPPQRGAFPLDHDAECKPVMESYLSCLKKSRGTNETECRLLAKAYLQCRMDRQLMAKDSWGNLGFQDPAKVQAAEKEIKVEENVLERLRRENAELVEKRKREEAGGK
ncbi:hypothetical protein EDC01DRAFT_668323 [Geopyxis carbonaria]|nr:hypothetical protein EDC01DRAFT_668323 [Geopyxis carbonaria]